MPVKSECKFPAQWCDSYDVFSEDNRSNYKTAQSEKVMEENERKLSWKKKRERKKRVKKKTRRNVQK